MPPGLYLQQLWSMSLANSMQVIQMKNIAAAHEGQTVKEFLMELVERKAVFTKQEVLDMIQALRRRESTAIPPRF